MKIQSSICLLHAYGQSTFTVEEIRAYGSLENLIASDTLAGVPNRENSLSQLWEAAQQLAELPDFIPPSAAEPEQEPQEASEAEE